MSVPVLHDYYRSSASYRVRIALNLKNVDSERRTVNLLNGAQRSDEYRQVNPQGFVPTLEIDDHAFTQSLAIIVYLDQRFPDPPLMPRNIIDQAHVRAMSLVIACDIHPLNNLRVLKHLKSAFDASDEQRDEWYRHWVREGLDALETMAAPRAGAFLFGDEVTLADVCLVPQLYNARRFGVGLDVYPTLVRADENANRLEAFAAAHPDRQEKPQ